MSTVAERKKTMGYRSKGPSCRNCIHYTSIVEQDLDFGYSHTRETCKRCTLGDFETKKLAWCAEHKFADNPS